MPFVPMFFATDIISCPSRNASCERISQHPMCPETVTAGLFAARNAFPAGAISPADSHLLRARKHVQNAYPTVRTLNMGALGVECGTAIGLATALPHRRVICHDSDGSQLLDLGCLAVLGNRRPKNLIVLCRSCHQVVGHKNNWKKFNQHVAEICEKYGGPPVDSREWRKENDERTNDGRKAEEQHRQDS